MISWKTSLIFLLFFLQTTLLLSPSPSIGSNYQPEIASLCLNVFNSDLAVDTSKLGSPPSVYSPVYSLFPTLNKNRGFLSLHNKLGQSKSKQPSSVSQEYTKKGRQYIVASPPLGLAFGSVYKGENFAPFARELGIKNIHINTTWKQLQPNRDHYDFSIVDSLLSQTYNDFEIMIRIKSLSSWGTKSPKSPSRPIRLDDYSTFIYKLVKHCNGRVRYWQTNWEPEMLGFWEGSKQEYIETSKTFYTAVKKAFPQSLVVGGGHSGAFTNGKPVGYDLYDHILTEGKSYFDLFDIHLFWDLYTVQYRINWFRKRMAHFGYSKPIISAAYGGPVPQQFPEHKQLHQRYRKAKKEVGGKEAAKLTYDYVLANRETLPPSIRMFLPDADPQLEEKRHRLHARDLVQRTVLALSAGVEKLWLWCLLERPVRKYGIHPIFGKLRLVHHDLNRKYPAFYGYQRLRNQIADIKSIQQYTTGNKNIFLFRIIKRNNQTLYIIWEKRNLFAGETIKPTSFSIKLGVTAISISDAFGNSATKQSSNGSYVLDLTDTPLFISPMQETNT